SRSDSHGNYPQHKSVCIVETPIDCPSSPDDTENPLVRQRSQSFRLAIERGTSIDSSLLSYDTGDPSSTSPDLSPEHAHPPPYPECMNRDHGQHSSMFSSGQFLNPPQQHRGKHDKLEQYSTDTTRSQRSRTKQEVNTKPTEPQVEMDIKNKEINVHLGADDGESPRSRRLSTLVEESDQEGEDLHAVRHLRSPRTPISPSYLHGLSKKPRTQSLPRYKEPPSYKDVIHTHSMDSSPDLRDRYSKQNFKF
ncbi:hypothetical protein LSH36_260g03000, partial [Paralvinella palmiformis]